MCECYFRFKTGLSLDARLELAPLRAARQTGPSGLTSIGLRNSAVGWLFAALVLYMAGPVKPSIISRAAYMRMEQKGNL